MTLAQEVADYRYGIRHNFTQFAHQLVQVFLVGLTLGMTRTVIPALAESEFGVAKGSFLLLAAFVMAFGFVKGILNFVAGRSSERWGRKNVLLLGWLVALPIPLLIYFAPSWNWIVAATVLLGINQGLTWSMTQTAKLDLTLPEQRGLVEKFVDALVWVFFPVYLYQRGLEKTGIGWDIGEYGFVWGLAQNFTGHITEHIGRKNPIDIGMWLSGAGVGLKIVGAGKWWWTLAAAIAGIGMALLYPTLSAAVTEIAHPNWRGSAIGIYRFWRDLGYGIGALALGTVAALFNNIEAAFLFTTIAIFISGAMVLFFCAETHPRMSKHS